MADIHQMITLGIGTPSDIAHLTLFGLSPKQAPVITGQSPRASRYRHGYRVTDVIRALLLVGGGVMEFVYLALSMVNLIASLAVLVALLVVTRRPAPAPVNPELVNALVQRMQQRAEGQRPGRDKLASILAHKEQAAAAAAQEGPVS